MEYTRQNIRIDLKGKRLLVVDDNAVLRSILSEYLKDFGCRVHEAANGREALEFCENRDFDVIITDIKMPFMNGIEFLRRLPERNHRCVRIMMSGEASIEDVVSGFKQEIDDFIIKPFANMEMIRQTIERQLVKVDLERELSYKNEVVRQMNEILQHLVSNTDTENLFGYIFRSLKNLVPVQRMELLLYDAERKNLSVKYLLSDRASSVRPGDSMPAELSGFADYLRHHDLFCVSDLNEYLKGGAPRPFFQKALDEGMNSSITFPMTVDNHIFGFLTFYCAEKRQYSQSHTNILNGIVPKLSVSFERSIYQGRLYEENTFLRTTLKKLTNQLVFQQESLIFSLAELAEKRDKETGFHLVRMQSFVKLLAQCYFKGIREYDIGFGRMPTERIVELIGKASPLHDIGKVGIPDAILLKPAKLDFGEFEVIKTHSQIGADCLESAAGRLSHHTDFLYVAKEIAYYHHERWDGKGYPEGLEGESIPISARIVALADTFDALRSKRPYKERWDHRKVCEHIRGERGRHFDPRLTDIFLEQEMEMDRIYNQFSS
jgi:response regulator RpfG family c-di-GMP phosphodiesterase